MAEVIWTKKAFGQFERAIKYILEEQGIHYAKIVRKKVLESTPILNHSPNIGTIEPLLAHKKSTYRFVVVYNYKIIYRTSASKVIISRVFHTSRNPQRLKGI